MASDTICARFGSNASCDCTVPFAVMDTVEEIVCTSSTANSAVSARTAHTDQ